jgi:hypothetical protein
MRVSPMASFMSGYSEHMSKWNKTEQDGRCFIAKPFTSAALLKKVREILDKENAQGLNAPKFG